MAPPGKCYFMKNPFNGDWEIVADTYETFQMAKKSGALTKAIRKLQENGALPREIIL